MALIKCPECGKDVSDQAVTCIHCGYPLQKKAEPKFVSTITQPSHTISNKPFYLFSFDESYVNLECGNCEKIYRFKKQSFHNIHDDSCLTSTSITCPNCHNAANENTKIQTKGNRKASIKREDDVLRCPRCKSTAVTTGTRGFSILTGFLGSGKTVNRCGKCGYTWKP